MKIILVVVVFLLAIIMQQISSDLFDGIVVDVDDTKANCLNVVASFFLSLSCFTARFVGFVYQIHSIVHIAQHEIIIWF